MAYKLTTARLASWSPAVTFLICFQAMLMTGCDQGKTYSYDSSKANNIKGGLNNPYASSNVVPATQDSSGGTQNQSSGNVSTPIPNTGSGTGTGTGNGTGETTVGTDPAEGDGTDGGGAAALDGLALYESSCQGCHGPATGNNIRNKTAEGTAAAVKSVGSMAGVKLGQEELEAIASAIAQ